MLVSCLLTLAAAWSSSATASQPQIALQAESSNRRPAPSSAASLSAGSNASASVISPELFAELEELARIVDISYCVGSVGLGVQKPFSCPSRCGDFPNFELVTTWNTGPMLSDSCGYIALSHPPSPKRIVVAFRGTYSLSNTIADLSTMPQEYSPYPGVEDPDAEPHVPKCLNCTVHTGFYTSWANTRDVVLPHILDALKHHPDYAITLVGHSLGGAVAALAGLDLLARGLRPTVTTFGEPRIGNADLARYLDERFNLTRRAHDMAAPRDSAAFRRVTHAADPIPLLPLDEWGYKPHSGEIYIAKRDLPPNVTDVRHCDGPEDKHCIAIPDEGGFWAIPARFKLWQLFFAHRDYFWRLGLCVPTMDGWWPQQMEETDL
ncbi:uncharacterized protein PV09_06913 [Verruconis gallopava]|uniref:Fungal lipase-type domain-containing protein n=1 Tax=Verruconis gallopava TaxID=253628 RepID=A0A0D1YLM0_9PEZI|nr:uncharacterized protein PV09_06913 [Verruconis gallopava]KIW01737.1 hypothetical protein PV09_06913 [Verruconis gallopava]